MYRNNKCNHEHRGIQHPGPSSLRLYIYKKIPTKFISAEDASRDPNTNFINFTNFVNVTVYVIYILNVLTTFITHLIHIMWNILKLLIILDFKVVNQ